MSLDFFEGNKSNRKADKKNPIEQIIDLKEDDNSRSQENQDLISNNSTTANINNELKNIIPKIIK